MSYQDLVLALKPSAYFAMDGARHGFEYDKTGHLGTANYNGTDSLDDGGGYSTTRMPNGDRAAAFDGESGFLEIEDRPTLSPTFTGRFSLSLFFRRDAYQFPKEAKNGYVPIVGKGTPHHHEYTTRVYSRDNLENRPCRVSGYCFKPEGDLGVGSYFQDYPVTLSEWIHLGFVINVADTQPEYPIGYTRIFRNGVRRDTDSLQPLTIVPQDGPAPVCVATRYGEGFFCGAVGHAAFWNRELADEEFLALSNGMFAP